MTWIAFGLVAAIFISSLHKILPRGRQLHLHRLREHARKLGFVVERQQGSARDAALEGCVGYRLALEKCPMEEEFSYRRTEAGWERRFGSHNQPHLAGLLTGLPANVSGLDRSSFSLTVYWVEPEDPQALDRLFVALQPLHRLPVE
ncbi:hypothetical protein [Pseudomonas profundi]|uniref:hypothetical protein n=1 Tax=Pseudomonas profundi TaxID=1981513 RepID=UPI00123C3181|nr:hypothetical protein [Pseudomonas profundi]